MTVLFTALVAVFLCANASGETRIQYVDRSKISAACTALTGVPGRYRHGCARDGLIILPAPAGPERHA